MREGPVKRARVNGVTGRLFRYDAAMQSKLLFATLTLALSTFALPACGGSGDDAADGPVIDSVSVSNSPVEPNDDGSYTVDISVTFDDTVDVDFYNFDSSAASIHLDEETIPDAASGQLSLEIDLPDGTDTGTADSRHRRRHTAQPEPAEPAASHTAR